jgi:hypothetical protein
MSDQPITVAQAEHQSAVDACIDAITANRGAPSAVTPVQRTPNMTYNTANPDQIGFHSEEDRRIAESAAPFAATLDDRDLSHELESLGKRFATEAAKLTEQVYDPKTGAASFKLTPGTAARIAQETKVGSLLHTIDYQKQVYQAALANREARNAANARGNDGAAIGVAWTGGDPRRQALLNEEIERAEARHVADAIIRAKLGNLGS